MKLNSVRFTSVFITAVFILPALAVAADQDMYSFDEIAKELSNPVTVLASIRTDLEYCTYQGDLPAASEQSNTGL